MTNTHKFSVKNFIPLTPGDGSDITNRKNNLKKEFDKQNTNLEEIKNTFVGKDVSINVCFKLFAETTDKSRYEKDLDNLLKIFSDVLKEQMDDDTKEPGLGIIQKNNDDLIFQIISRKKFVKTEQEEGMEVEISEFPDRWN